MRVQITPVRVRGDAHHLEQAIRNVVDNAARHARTRVTIAVWDDGSHAHMLVADDGPGVAPRDRQRIFNRFVRLDDARTRADGGSGLGLAIASEIIAGHGGEISVTDDPERIDHGGGAVFHIRLPLAPPTGPPAADAAVGHLAGRSETA